MPSGERGLANTMRDGSGQERGLRALARRLCRCRRGATAIEYGLIMALVVLAMMAALRGLAGATVGMWNGVDSAVANAR